jgi:hypothetical protein
MDWTPTTLIFLNTEINAALSRAGLPHDHPMRPLLEEAAEVVDSSGAYFVRVQNNQGFSVSLKDRIAELKEDPRFRDSIPHQPTIAATDAATIKKNFEKIARGEVVVS